MTAAAMRRDPGNAVVAIANAARSIDIAVLVAIETLGFAAGIAIYWAAPRRWPLTLPCLAIACFGLWGLCDRRIALLTSHREKRQRRLLRFVARCIAAGGVTAALLAAYLFIGWTMGVYIS